MTDRNTSPASPTSPGDLWSAVDALWAWLEGGRRHGDRESLLLRVLKISEEVGEVAEAVIGATGQNPRKGISHTWDDVEAELCDVVITALIALRTLTPDTRETFTRHLARVTERSLSTSWPHTATGPDSESDSGPDSPNVGHPIDRR
ncbi:MazG-like family protein [Streptomyces sp. NPDC101152]|uniref:MazG-like family protein n=1 Tax=Streptomyces sp. NPDC101152 TaxID=3366116 RepID=UPI00380AED15